MLNNTEQAGIAIGYLLQEIFPSRKKEFEPMEMANLPRWPTCLPTAASKTLAVWGKPDPERQTLRDIAYL